MTNEELLAKFEAMERKLANLEAENQSLLQRGSRSAGDGINHTSDTAFGNTLSGLVAARSVTIATRPVRDEPERYPTAVFSQIQRPGVE